MSLSDGERKLDLITKIRAMHVVASESYDLLTFQQDRDIRCAEESIHGTFRESMEPEVRLEVTGSSLRTWLNEHPPGAPLAPLQVGTLRKTFDVDTWEAFGASLVHLLEFVDEIDVSFRDDVAVKFLEQVLERLADMHKRMMPAEQVLASQDSLSPSSEAKSALDACRHAYQKLVEAFPDATPWLEVCSDSKPPRAEDKNYPDVVFNMLRIEGSPFILRFPMISDSTTGTQKRLGFEVLGNGNISFLFLDSEVLLIRGNDATLVDVTQNISSEIVVMIHSTNGPIEANLASRREFVKAMTFLIRFSVWGLSYKLDTSVRKNHELVLTLENLLSER